MAAKTRTVAPRGLSADARILFDRTLDFRDALIEYFTGSSQLTEDKYSALRAEFLDDPNYGDLAPKWLRRNKNLSSLWQFAKSVDRSYEPRRQFLRSEFEPLLDYLERGGTPTRMPGSYDASAWTGVQSTAQQTRAIQTLIPVAQASVEALILHLETPNHNGAPPLEEVAAAIEHLRALHSALGTLLTATDQGRLKESIDAGLMGEISRYGRQATRALRNDPLPYALSGTLLAVFAACGIPWLGGYLGGIALAIKKPGQPT